MIVQTTLHQRFTFALVIPKTLELYHLHCIVLFLVVISTPIVHPHGAPTLSTDPSLKAMLQGIRGDL
jgi:hypothetical protein